MNAVPRIQVFQCPKCNAMYPTDQWNVQKGRCNRCARNKHGNKKITVDGVTYDSIKEANYHQELYRRLQAGEVERIIYHPRFDIVVAGVYIGKYTADFKFYDLTTQQEMIVDVKGPSTRKNTAYRLRKKLVEAIYNTVITEA